MTMYVGLDFGTTNSAIATALPDRTVRVPQFRMEEGYVRTFRSIIYFSSLQFDRNGQPLVFTGPKGLEHYLEEGGEGRLVLSPKNSLANTMFESTRIQFKHYKLEELIAFILRDLCFVAQEQLGALGSRVVAGRPVHFAGGQTQADETIALQRLTKALQSVGFSEILFEYEPVAAAYCYDRELNHDELILVADFGGGTADFCVMEVGPNARRKKSSQRILGTDGVGVAGDTFDSRVVHHLFSPYLGRGSSFRSQFGDVLPMPMWIYSKLSQWYTIGLLRDKKTLNMLNDLHRESLEPEKVGDLIEFIEHELGFYLYQAVEHAKIQLSSAEHTPFRFSELHRPIETSLSRFEFEDWIQADVAAISQCCDRLMASIGLAPSDVDKVFLTGGSSLVPRVRRWFQTRFGEDKIGDGDTFTSVAQGLALRALDLTMS